MSGIDRCQSSLRTCSNVVRTINVVKTLFSCKITPKQTLRVLPQKVENGFVSIMRDSTTTVSGNCLKVSHEVKTANNLFYLRYCFNGQKWVGGKHISVIGLWHRLQLHLLLPFQSILAAVPVTNVFQSGFLPTKMDLRSILEYSLNLCSNYAFHSMVLPAKFDSEYISYLLIATNFIKVI